MTADEAAAKSAVGTAALLLYGPTLRRAYLYNKPSGVLYVSVKRITPGEYLWRELDVARAEDILRMEGWEPVDDQLSQSWEQETIQ